MPIITNNHIRDYIDGSDVPNSEKDDWNSECSLWINYRGMYIALMDFISSPDSEWDGSYGLSNTASIVIKLLPTEQYVIGVAT